MNKAFVIGHPIAHSKSPLIHGTWLAELGIDGIYEPIDVAPEALGDFLAGVRAGSHLGGNVTIPHKESVMDLLDEIDPLARRIGAVNTIVNRHGQLYGTNTDYEGFLANLDTGAPGWDRGLTHAVVLGAGGAARAVLVGLLDRGVGRIDLLNRSPERAEALARELGGPIHPGGLADFGRRAEGAGFVINTSAVGMGGTAFAEIELSGLRSGAVVTDIVYTPLITPLLREAGNRGFASLDGLGMLLHQAVPGFAAWFGQRPEVSTALREKVLAASRP